MFRVVFTRRSRLLQFRQLETRKKVYLLRSFPTDEGLKTEKGSSLSCTWMDQKFSQYSENSLILLDAMGRTEDAGAEDALLPFPYNLYQKASKASAEDKLLFTVQILREVSALFEEDYSAASWEESTVDHFLNVLNKQADELSSCIVSQHQTRIIKKMHMYFERLSHQVLQNRSHSVAAWELMRREIKLHLILVDHLVSSAY